MARLSGARVLLRWRGGECVHKADGHGVLVIHRGKRRTTDFAGPVREYVLVRHITPILQAAKDMTRQSAFEGSCKFPHLLCGPGRKSVVVDEVFATRSNRPLGIRRVLDISSEATPPDGRYSGESFVTVIVISQSESLELAL